MHTGPGAGRTETSPEQFESEMIGLVAGGAVEPDQVLTQRGEMTGAIEAYEQFDKRASGWMKVDSSRPGRM